jgi:peptide/nickel transport system permease protein
MSQYLLRRLVLMVPTFLVVSVLVFAMMRLIPGDVIDIMVQGDPNRATADALRAELGLDRPAPYQYFVWLGNILQGDLGQSLYTKKPVTDELAWRVPVTLEMAFLSLSIALLIAAPIAVVSATRQDRAADYALRTAAIGAVAIPSFWIATLSITIPSILWGWAPPLKFVPIDEDTLEHFGGLLIPALILSLSLMGRVVRLLRAMLLEVLHEDYVRTAWAKGLRETVVLRRHAIRNALIPVITVIGLEIPLLLGGTVVVEEIFNLPGMGRFILQSLQRRDYIPAQSVILLFAVATMLINLITDALYSALDPRIRYS